MDVIWRKCKTLIVGIDVEASQNCFLRGARYFSRPKIKISCEELLIDQEGQLGDRAGQAYRVYLYMKSISFNELLKF